MDDMPVCYVSGPYTADTMNGVYENIHKARTAAFFYWNRGFSVICPHMNTAFMDGNGDHGKWIRGDLAIIDRLRLERSDFMVMLSGWRGSKGAVEEKEFAEKKGLDVVYY